MNSKGHLTISILKSAVRIISGSIAMAYGNTTFIILGGGLVIAEILGIIEELVDKR